MVIDQTSQNQGLTAIAQQHNGEKHFTLLGDGKLQAMSAFARDYYQGVDQQRTVIMLESEEFEKPLIVDLFRIISEEEHTYDYPVHYKGQIIRTDFEYEMHKSLGTVGDAHGYQHLWNLGQGKVEGSSLTTWLMGDSYYSLISSANANSEVIFARIGANDPDFNLRNEPMFMLRQKAANHLFANVYETHGYFNESVEASLNARGQVETVEVLQADDTASVVALHLVTGKKRRLPDTVSPQKTVFSLRQDHTSIAGRVSEIARRALPCSPLSESAPCLALARGLHHIWGLGSTPLNPYASRWPARFAHNLRMNSHDRRFCHHL